VQNPDVRHQSSDAQVLDVARVLGGSFAAVDQVELELQPISRLHEAHVGRCA